MPFRVGFNYESMAVVGRDPSREELAAYIMWLETELATAKANFDAIDADEKPNLTPKKAK